MRVALAIIGKDIHGALRDRSAIVISVLAPLALIVILSLLMKGPDVSAQKVAYVRSPSPAAIDTLLREHVLPDLARDKLVTVAPYRDRAAAAKANTKRSASAVSSLNTDPGGSAA